MAENTTRRVSRRKVMRAEARIVLLMLVLIGGVVGLFIGKSQAETITETVTLTETVEVPTYDADKLPETSEVFYFDVPLSHSLQRFMYEVCADNGVPITLVLAMVEHESQFNPEAISKTDDYGLMQINQVNHSFLKSEYRCANMLDPYQNIFCGVQILGSYLKKYEGNYAKALMAYNMGDYGAKKAWEQGIFSTGYTDIILELWRNYEEVAANAKSNIAQ